MTADIIKMERDMDKNFAEMFLPKVKSALDMVFSIVPDPKIREIIKGLENYIADEAGKLSKDINIEGEGEDLDDTLDDFSEDVQPDANQEMGNEIDDSLKSQDDQSEKKGGAQNKSKDDSDPTPSTTGKTGSKQNGGDQTPGQDSSGEGEEVEGGEGEDGEGDEDAGENGIDDGEAEEANADEQEYQDLEKELDDSYKGLDNENGEEQEGNKTDGKDGDDNKEEEKNKKKADDEEDEKGKKRQEEEKEKEKEKEKQDEDSNEQPEKKEKEKTKQEKIKILLEKIKKAAPMTGRIIKKRIKKIEDDIKKADKLKKTFERKKYLVIAKMGLASMRFLAVMVIFLIILIIGIMMCFTIFFFPEGLMLIGWGAGKLVVEAILYSGKMVKYYGELKTIKTQIKQIEKQVRSLQGKIMVLQSTANSKFNQYKEKIMQEIDDLITQ